MNANFSEAYLFSKLNGCKVDARLVALAYSSKHSIWRESQNLLIQLLTHHSLLFYRVRMGWEIYKLAQSLDWVKIFINCLLLCWSEVSIYKTFDKCMFNNLRGQLTKKGIVCCHFSSVASSLMCYTLLLMLVPLH